MNVEAVLKEAEEILFFEFFKRNATVSPQWLKQHRKEVNDLFNKYINEKQFPDPSGGGKGKVNYRDLPPKFKEKVWTMFMNEVVKEVDPIEQQIEDVIKNFKPQVMSAV